MKLGLIGLPNVGKSTLFNAITKAGAVSANYPFCTIEPNVGVTAVPDPRVDKLAEMYSPPSVVNAVIECVDIAGLVRGASKGEGLGNKFLSHIREVDAVLHVLRCFESDDIIHTYDTVDAVRDMGIVNLELILADLEVVERALNKSKKAKEPDAEALQLIYDTLAEERMAYEAPLDDEQRELVKHKGIITLIPQIFVANLSVEDIANPDANPHYVKLCEYAKQRGIDVIPINAKLEEDIADFDAADQLEYMRELGLSAERTGLDTVVTVGYHTLGLISFLTAGPKEVRAWTVTRGSKAVVAAGKIHSDIARGFIRAEIIGYDELMEIGSMTAAKEKGKVRLEGKDYIMQDGDVVYFRFNV